MTYRIRFRNTGSIHTSEPKNLIEARTTAISLSHWNQRVDLIDLETGEIVERFEPYSEEGALALEGITPGGRCRCGKSLPNVRVNEVPYEFCSEACKQAAAKV